MFAITGITGQVGAQVADNLLNAGHSVRAVLRNQTRARRWLERGCEIALASMDDVTALTNAFGGAEAVFVLLPPIFDPTPGFVETRRNVAALVAALRQATPQRVVCISTIGVQAQQENLLTQLQIMERAIEALPMPVAFLRAAWFMENVAWDIESARSLGVISSFLQPLDKPIPMVATADVAHTVAQLLQERWSGRRIIELQGPRPISPNELATTLGDILQREVVAQPVPRDTWQALFESQGMSNPMPRMRMLDGFNENWIVFENGSAESQRGTTSLEAVIRSLIASR